MAYDKVIDSAKLDAAMAATANAIRSKTGDSASIEWAQETGFADAVSGIQSGGGGGGSAAPVAEKEVNFYDYDGTLLYSYTVAEAQALTELPAGPEHEGLIFQGWNWSLEDVNALTRTMDIGTMYTTDDGTTRIYIHLAEGRTSPMLGVCPNGTVTVDWGDGTTPDVLTGTSTSAVVWTPTHEYAATGDYVIRLAVNGEVGFGGVVNELSGGWLLRYSAEQVAQNRAYCNAVQRVEIGNNVTVIGEAAFAYYFRLKAVSIPFGVGDIGRYAFNACKSLTALVIPLGVTELKQSLAMGCGALRFASLPGSLVSIGDTMFNSCASLQRLNYPDNVNLSSVQILNGCSRVESFVVSRASGIALNGFSNASCLRSLFLCEGIKTLGDSCFYNCYSITSMHFPDSVTTIQSGAFGYCYSMRFYDFSRHASVPTLSNTNAFNKIPADCEIRVPAALYDEWIAATNWSTYADYIVAV